MSYNKVFKARLHLIFLGTFFLVCKSFSEFAKQKSERNAEKKLCSSNTRLEFHWRKCMNGGDEEEFHKTIRNYASGVDNLRLVCSRVQTETFNWSALWLYQRWKRFNDCTDRDIKQDCEFYSISRLMRLSAAIERFSLSSHSLSYESLWSHSLAVIHLPTSIMMHFNDEYLPLKCTFRSENSIHSMKLTLIFTPLHFFYFSSLYSRFVAITIPFDVAVKSLQFMYALFFLLSL